MKKIIEYVKYVLIILLVVFISSLLADDNISKAKIDNVTKAVANKLKDDSLSPAANRMVKRLYGLNPGDYDGISVYISDSNMKVEEFLLVKLKDTSQADAVQAAAKARLDRQLESFEGYGPEQCKLLKDHILDVQGNYILFVVHKNAKAADKAFQKSL